MYRCNYCCKEYGTKNVTKFRVHLINKCIKIPANVRKQICEQIKGSGGERMGAKRGRSEDDIDEEEEEEDMAEGNMEDDEGND